MSQSQRWCTFCKAREPQRHDLCNACRQKVDLKARTICNKKFLQDEPAVIEALRKLHTMIAEESNLNDLSVNEVFQILHKVFPWMFLLCQADAKYENGAKKKLPCLTEANLRQRLQTKREKVGSKTEERELLKNEINDVIRNGMNEFIFQRGTNSNSNSNFNLNSYSNTKNDLNDSHVAIEGETQSDVASDNENEGGEDGDIDENELLTNDMVTNMRDDDTQCTKSSKISKPSKVSNKEIESEASHCLNSSLSDYDAIATENNPILSRKELRPFRSLFGTSSSQSWTQSTNNSGSISTFDSSHCMNNTNSSSASNSTKNININSNSHLFQPSIDERWNSNDTNINNNNSNCSNTNLYSNNYNYNNYNYNNTVKTWKYPRPPTAHVAAAGVSTSHSNQVNTNMNDTNTNSNLNINMNLNPKPPRIETEPGERGIINNDRSQYRAHRGLPNPQIICSIHNHPYYTPHTVSAKHGINNYPVPAHMMRPQGMRPRNYAPQSAHTRFAICHGPTQMISTYPNGCHMNHTYVARPNIATVPRTQVTKHMVPSLTATQAAPMSHVPQMWHTQTQTQTQMQPMTSLSDDMREISEIGGMEQRGSLRMVSLKNNNNINNINGDGGNLNSMHSNMSSNVNQNGWNMNDLNVVCETNRYLENGNVSNTNEVKEKDCVWSQNESNANIINNAVGSDNGIDLNSSHSKIKMKSGLNENTFQMPMFKNNICDETKSNAMENELYFDSAFGDFGGLSGTDRDSVTFVSDHDLGSYDSKIGFKTISTNMNVNDRNESI